MIEKAKAYVKQLLERESTGHDYYHSLRVMQTAQAIARTEGNADLETVQLMALLHDVDDAKLFPKTWKTLAHAREFLEENSIPSSQKEVILEGIANLSFKGTGNSVPASLEGKIVQDADRLDAIGAIGIARTFAFGGNRGRILYAPEDPDGTTGHTIHHFYEKLLLLKDRMNTRTGRELANQRHAFMESFLAQFYAEWDGSR